MKKIMDWEFILPAETIALMRSLPAKRRSGRTTMMANHYVERCLINGGCKSIDHSLDVDLSKRLASIVRKRLVEEHGCPVFPPGTDEEIKRYNMGFRKCFDYDGVYTFVALNQKISANNKAVVWEDEHGDRPLVKCHAKEILSELSTTHDYFTPIQLSYGEKMKAVAEIKENLKNLGKL